MSGKQQPLLPGKQVEAQREVRLGVSGKEEDDRAKAAGDPRTNNVVKTSKYEVFPLHPHFILWKNLWEQFHRYANVYFLIVATLQLIPGLSPTGRYTTLIPLTVVLLLTMVKDGFEDHKRHVRDREVNNQEVEVWRGSGWQEVCWKDVLVGDYCKVMRGRKDKNGKEKDAEFPADLLLLWSNEPQSLCQIETSNLDGETNLKLRKAHTEPTGSPAKPFDPIDESVDWQERLKKLNPSAFTGVVECQPPNKDLYSFEGRLKRDVPNGAPTTSAVDVVSILLRGAKLGCTKVVIGVALYTGAQSKLMMNQQKARHKASQLEMGTNQQIKSIVVMQACLCISCAIGLYVTVGVLDDHWYIGGSVGAPALAALKGLATFLILFNNLIPISLYVTMEFVKIMQAKLMDSDLDMYHAESDTPASARTSSLNEELGQVQYIFSDKTGTLTCNIMDFLKFSVGNTSYGTGTTEIGRAAAAREGKVLKDDRPPDIKPIKGFFFYDPRISDAEETKNWAWMKQPNRAELEHFLKVLAVCHTVVIEEDTAPDGVVTKKYQAASPDEQCLVSGAKFLGFEFIDRNTTDITIHAYDKGGGQYTKEQWGLREVLEFNSDRKRMSVIVTDPRGRLLLLCKGADTVIYERLKKYPAGDPRDETLTKTKEFLRQFAADGLRTLCIAQAEIDESFYGHGVQNNTSWQYRYKQAKEAVGGREEKVTACAEEIEKDLELLGTTAIEDKLQMGVPSAIELLRCAGVNVWVLTGDKQETAINIGFACALLHNNMWLLKFEEGEPPEKLKNTIVNYRDSAEKSRRENPNQDVGVVVQGGTLMNITADTADKENKDNFLMLTQHCRAVICCRVTPGQKAEVVRMVKEGLNKVTLSIGDGANDVAMITEAHVGIGISGLEGLQAARAADYAIGQFRFLKELLLIHGRWNYRRMSKVIVYSFYKNILLYLTQFWFCWFNAFTGQSLYDRWSIAGFNVGFTALPIIAVGMFDRDIEKKRVMSLEQFPELYDAGREKQFFSTWVFWAYTGAAIWQSAVCFFVPMLALSNTESADPNYGRPVEMHWLGITAYTCVIWVVTLKIALETTSWTKWNHLSTWGSLITWYIFLIIYGEIWAFILELGEDWHKMYLFVLTDFKHWAVVVIAIIISLFRDVAWKYAQRDFDPMGTKSLLHKVQRWEGYVRDGKALKDFNYRMMQKQHPEVLKRPRQSAAPIASEEEEEIPETPPLHQPPVTVSPTSPDVLTQQRHLTAPQTVQRAPSEQNWSRVGQPYAYDPPDVSTGAYRHHNPMQPAGSRMRRAPPGHHAPPLAQYAERAGNETGFSFSQAEGNQVEYIAARAHVGRSSGWAQGFGSQRMPSPRAQVAVPGTMAIGGMVDSHEDRAHPGQQQHWQGQQPHQQSYYNRPAPSYGGAPATLGTRSHATSPQVGSPSQRGGDYHSY
eukprot:Hpha_TRINITY_DN16024_c4_g9::TRINITY_DN16024_c4_g9_i1::g.122357::m.122357/K14802/DRS2, ATP8A; phospholipid-transporting ATPase